MALTNGHGQHKVVEEEQEEITVFELELEDDGSPSKERSVSILRRYNTHLRGIELTSL